MENIDNKPREKTTALLPRSAQKCG